MRTGFSLMSTDAKPLFVRMIIVVKDGRICLYNRVNRFLVHYYQWKNIFEGMPVLVSVH